MAKRRRGSRGPGRVGARNARRISLNSLFDRLPPGTGIRLKFPDLKKPVTAHRIRALHDIEDRRRFSPNPYEAKTLSGVAVKRFVDVENARTRQRQRGRKIRIVDEGHPLARFGGKYGLSFAELIRSDIGFDNPDRVIICVRRRQRKQIMFATKKAGAGKKRQRRPRRNHFSEVRC